MEGEDCGCNRLWREDRVYVIADVGSNHNGSLGLALSLIEEAKFGGADAVKFQLFRFEDVYQDPEVAPTYAVMNPEWVPELVKKCEIHKIDFLCTPFAPWAADVLRPYVKYWKIGSFEAQDEALREATLDKQRIVSLGMTGGEEAVKMIEREPETIWLHCASRYPTPLEEVGFNRISWLKRLTPYVGFSDHTEGRYAALMAVALGCQVIEHHLKLEQQPKTPDSGEHAMTPYRFKWYTQAIHRARQGRDWDYRLPSYKNRKVHGR